MLKGKGLVASIMQIPLTNSLLVTASRYSRAPAFLLERAGGRKQGALGRPGGGAWRKDSGAEIEPSSVEPDSETGKF
jgi:hypothetical protein